MRDTDEKFTWPTVGLHWILAIAMIAMLVFGLYLEEMPRSPEKGELIGLHKSIGVMIFVLAVARVYLRFLNKFPRPMSVLTNWQEKLAKVTHWVLIIGTLLMPVSGVIMAIGGGHPVALFGLEFIVGTGVKNEILSNIGKAGHGLGGKLLILFVLFHFIGAIKRQFFDKDGTISRMLGIKVRAEHSIE
ncbi:MAG: cytochrome b [Gammaproteobacteria bacterium]|nr:cytochrome b [Gammaproteobacteria bacterium]MCW8987448.1 cytochrome b [Gammaproteobacteria bacterium]